MSFIDKAFKNVKIITYGSIKMSSYSTKVRTRKVDPLHQTLKAIDEGNLRQLQATLNDQMILNQFKLRLMAQRVPKDHSPLVKAILHGDLEVFKFILDDFPVNLEQETSTIIEGGYPVEGATPLWTASTLGRLDFVKLLVDKGADIEHTTDSKSSPLRGAAFDGHCEVCEYLISKGADIDKPNQVGQSPLTIAAAMQKKECVQLLINKGADVNHKGHNGDTPLHVSVESGAVEIAKVLVSAGAKNSPNEVGFTPAILACCYGHKEVMKYLNSTFNLNQRELYDCYCLLAAKEVLGNNTTQAETHMRKSLAIREKNPSLFTSLPPADPIYDQLQEPSNILELQFILADETRMFFLSSIYCERILGRVHPTTAFYIRISGDMVLADERYQKCIDLWHRSLDFDDAARMAYELQITEDLLFAVRGFSIMCDNKFIPPIQSHFRWGLKEFRMAHESKISEIAVVSCLFRMIAVWIKISDCIEDKKEQEDEKLKILGAVDDLIEAMHDNGCPVLIACLQNLPEHTSGAGKDIIKIGIPLHKAVVLLLDRGCSVHCEDENGNFALHLAVRLLDDSAPHCIRTLLEYGAHYDAVNFNQETALDLARSQVYPPPVDGVIEELVKASITNMSLQCLASQVVVRHSLQYATILPSRIVEFVSWHEGDNSTIEHAHVQATNQSSKAMLAIGAGVKAFSVASRNGENSVIVGGPAGAQMMGSRGHGARAASGSQFVLTHPPHLNSNPKPK